MNLMKKKKDRTLKRNSCYKTNDHKEKGERMGLLSIHIFMLDIQTILVILLATM